MAKNLIQLLTRQNKPGAAPLALETTPLVLEEEKPEALLIDDGQEMPN